MDAVQLFLSSPTLQLLSTGIREQLEQWLSCGDELSILISGRTGGGKSTLVNSLLGESLAEEGATPDPSTAEVTCYERSLSGVRVKVWDSPGLQDGTTNEERYLSDIAAKCVRIDLLLFCINVGDAIRFNTDSPEVKALGKLTKRLGTGIWDHAMVALTFANKLGRTNEEFRRAKREKKTAKLCELFCKKISEWQEFVRDILIKTTVLSKAQVYELKIVPTGSRKDPSLPDRTHWLSSFWFEALRSTHPRAQPALLRMNEARIVENPDTVDEKDREKHCEDQTFVFCEFGGEVGRMLHGSEDLGSLVGLTVAEIRGLELKEQILLEQFTIMRTVEQQKIQQRSAPVSISGGVQDHQLTESLSSTLSQLAVGSANTPHSVESVPAAVGNELGDITGAPQDIPQRVEEEEEIEDPMSPQSECGGPFYDDII